MDSRTRSQIVSSLRAAAKVLHAAAPPKTPAGLKGLVKALEAEYPNTKFTVDAFDRQGEVSFTLRASTLPNRDILRMFSWPQKSGAVMVDVIMLDATVELGREDFPSTASLLKYWKILQAKEPVVIGPKPAVLPADPKIAKVTVKPYIFDEWVGLTIMVTGDWTRTDRSVSLSPEEEAFAKRVFEKSLPEIQKQAAKFANKTAKVLPDGGGGYDEDDESNLVEKAYPQVRSFRDVGQVDFNEDEIRFDVSDR